MECALVYETAVVISLEWHKHWLLEADLACTSHKIDELCTCALMLTYVCLSVGFVYVLAEQQSLLYGTDLLAQVTVVPFSDGHPRADRP